MFIDIGVINAVSNFSVVGDSILLYRQKWGKTACSYPEESWFVKEVLGDNPTIDKVRKSKE